MCNFHSKHVSVSVKVGLLARLICFVPICDLNYVILEVYKCVRAMCQPANTITNQTGITVQQDYGGANIVIYNLKKLVGNILPKSCRNL